MLTRFQIFACVFFSIVLIAASWREWRNGNVGLSVALAALPIAGWLALIFGRDALAP